MDDSLRSDTEDAGPRARARPKRRRLRDGLAVARVLVVTKPCAFHVDPTQARDALDVLHLPPLHAPGDSFVLGVVELSWCVANAVTANADAFIPRSIALASLSDRMRCSDAQLFVDYAIRDATWIPPVRFIRGESRAVTMIEKSHCCVY